MPSVKNRAFITGLSASQVFEGVQWSARQVGSNKFQVETFPDDPNAKELRTHFPSAWGWGGFNINITVGEETNGIRVELVGNISQFSVSPLTKKMDKFLDVLAEEVTKHNGTISYENLTRFIPKYTLHFDRRDRYILIAATLLGLATELPRLLLQLRYVNIAPAIWLVGIFWMIASQFIKKSKEQE